MLWDTQYVVLEQKGKINAPHILSGGIKSWAANIGEALAWWIRASAGFALAAKIMTELLGFEVIKKCVGVLLVVKFAVWLSNYVIQDYSKIKTQVGDEMHSKFHDVDRAAEAILLKKGQPYEFATLSNLMNKEFTLNIKFAGVCMKKTDYRNFQRRRFYIRGILMQRRFDSWRRERSNG